MTSTAPPPHAMPNFILSPHQQELLFAALNSNRSNSVDGATTQNRDAASTAFTESPISKTPASGTLGGLDDSEFVDYEYEFDGDGSFDYDFANASQDQMIGALPGTSSDGDAESHEKRSHPEDDEHDEEGGGKRRESNEEKGTKKAGRKPLTSEPTSKRKAQNRAAQRAFRERKEKHLKDLETKVDDLEKASESANHENAMLRAQVERMSVELKEFRKKLSVARSSQPPAAVPSYMAVKREGSNTVNSLNDVNFQFEFPKFGQLPGPPVLDASTTKTSEKPVQTDRTASTSSVGISPTKEMISPASGFEMYGKNKNGPGNSFGQLPNNDMSEFSGLFSPSMLDAASKDFSFEGLNSITNPTRSYSGSAHGRSSVSHSTSYNSPSDSSICASNQGLGSSAGTSPEPNTQSPAPAKPLDHYLGTVAESRHSSVSKNSLDNFGEKMSMTYGGAGAPVPRTLSTSIMPGEFASQEFDVNNLDWFGQHQVSTFDPQLFGDYRESQNNILAGNGLYDDSFFNEAIAMPEFNTPATSPQATKKDLVAQIDEKLNEDDEIIPGEGRMLTCNKMWERLQSCPKIQNGEIDMDSLCSQLQQKAKCSGSGPVINEQDFSNVITSMFPPGTNCPPST